MENCYGTGETLDFLTPNSPAKSTKSTLLKAIGGLNTFDLAGDVKVMNASNMFDRNYMQGKITWMQANPNAMFTDLIQYRIAQEAADLTQRSFVSIDDRASAAADRQIIERDYADVEEELAAEAAEQEIIDASKANNGVATFTTDEMLNQIEGGN